MCVRALICVLKREYTCNKASRTPNEAASARCDTLVYTVSLSMHEQPWFASHTARPELSVVNQSK